MAKWLIVLWLVLLDQIAKILVLYLLPQVVTNNQGVSFGLFPSSWWLIFNLLIIMLLIIYWWKSREIAMSLILAGGLSNLLDRILRRKVVDFIDLNSWIPQIRNVVAIPSFNLADVFICLGVVYFIWHLVDAKTS